MTSAKLNIGILGCGPIAQFAHLEASRKAENVNLYAVCDMSTDLANKMGTYYEADKIYHNYRELLNDKSVDAIIIATSDAFHIPASIKAIKSGKHVLVEKPLGTDLEKVDQLKQLVETSGLTLQVGHMKRFDPGINFAHKFINAELGEMIAYKAWYCDSTHRYPMTDSTQPLPFSGSETVKPALDPKADLGKYYLLAHGSHLLDTARFLAGRILSVQATLVHRHDIYSWFISTEFANGCNGHLDLTVAVRMDWHEGFQIYGDKGSVLGKIFNPWYFKSSEVQCFSARNQQYHQLLDNKAHFFHLQLEAFADTILNGTAQRGTDIAQGIQSLQAIEAVIKSVKTGTRVNLEDLI